MVLAPVRAGDAALSSARHDPLWAPTRGHGKVVASQENVELIYRGIDAYNRRDLDAFLALCDPEVEFYSRLIEVEGGGPLRGHDPWSSGSRRIGAAVN